ncbi:MAG: ImmA/IrrE family metallo-endopeptidase [Moraxella sp.]|nr:ImmA/IrrE family metallo-endopeptidase [Moraxella sp.]
MNPREIQAVAGYIIKRFDITKESLQQMDKLIDRLWYEASIVVDVVDDKRWLKVANAWFDPVNYQISIPQSLYNALLHKRLTKAKKRAIAIFFHELGHLSLSHKAVLHHTNASPTQYEDAEWQADYFADEILLLMGVQNKKQLTLF